MATQAPAVPAVEAAAGAEVDGPANEDDALCQQQASSAAVPAASTASAAALLTTQAPAAGAGVAVDGPAAAAAADEDDSLCICCLETPRSVMFTHGNHAHLCMCRGCASRYNWASAGCAVCRQQVEQVVHLD
jgi:hypothetical protein